MKPNHKKQYGPFWTSVNNEIKAGRAFYQCENCGGENPTLHHIAPQNDRQRFPGQADNPHFWMLLCGTCHWYASRFPYQPFQIKRIIKWEKLVHGFSVGEIIKGAEPHSTWSFGE